MRKLALTVSLLAIATSSLLIPSFTATAASAKRAVASDQGRIDRGRARPFSSPQVIPSAAIVSIPTVKDLEFAFWRCPSNLGLCEAFYNGTRWTQQEIPGMGALGSEPSVSLDASPSHSAGIYGSPYQYVFWQGNGPDYDLWEAYWDGSWHGPVSIDVGPLASNPSVPQTWYGPGLTMTSNGEAVAWTGTDSNLWYTTSTDPVNPNSWSAPSMRPVGPLARPPEVIDAGGGWESAWWQGQNGHLYSASIVFSGSGGTQYGPCNFGMGTLGSQPSPTWTITSYLSKPRHSPSSLSEGKLLSPRADVPRPDVSGNCPPVSPNGAVWYGTGGTYWVCWAALSPGSGLWCMEWGTPSDVTQGAIIQGPFAEGSMGLLGSAPSLASWATQPGSLIMGFWAGSSPADNPDLWVTPSLFQQYTPYDTGMLINYR